MNTFHVFKNICPLCPQQYHMPFKELKVTWVSASAIKNFLHVSGWHTNSFLGHKNAVIRTENTLFYYINQRKNCFIKFIKDTRIQEKKSNILLPPLQSFGNSLFIWKHGVVLHSGKYIFEKVHCFKNNVYSHR